MNTVLDDLLSVDFRLALGVVSSPAAMRRCLRRSPQVQRLIAAWRSGGVSEESIRRFVARLSREFVPGLQFHHELALAAIATALESTYSAFATEYLTDLARLKRTAAFHFAPRVADDCLRDRDRSQRYDLRRSNWGCANQDEWKVKLRPSRPIAARSRAIERRTVNGSSHGTHAKA